MKLCIFYQEVKDLKDGEARVLSCGCRRHKGQDISVVAFDRQIKEVRL
jgi:hypothetical protein